MAYGSRYGKRPDEYASKSSHSNIINDEYLKKYLKNCRIPKKSGDIKIEYEPHELGNIESNPIKHIIAIDGGYTEVAVKEEFPSSTISFFQFGALTFSISALDEISEQPFIDPEDMSRLKKNFNRLKLIIPTKNITLRSESSLTNTIRKTLFNFFNTKPEGHKFIDTLKWFIFEEYKTPIPEWHLSNCPSCAAINIPLIKSEMDNYQFICPYCNSKIFLTDVFRLHEVIDDELGAGGILGYLTTTLEQLLLIHIIRIFLEENPELLNQILFVKDGPLAFFGQTANMQRPMRKLVNFLFDNYELYLVGLEKSGAFVEHADEIFEKIPEGSTLILNNDYIYRHILLGKADLDKPYGRNTYYGNKLIFKMDDNKMHVATLPTTENFLSPKIDDFRNIDVIYHNIGKLKCDMYDNSLIPVTLVNKLVSLSDHPSSALLITFAKGEGPK